MWRSDCSGDTSLGDELKRRQRSWAERARLVEVGDQADPLLSMRRRDVLHVEVRVELGTGVVLRTDEPGVVRYVDAPLAQQGAHLRPVRHRGEGPGAGPAVLPTTCSAIVG